MRTLVCDLGAEERRSIGADQLFDAVIGREDLEASHPCAGCFGCWTRTPGRCVVRDPLSGLGPLLGVTSELAIVSRASFGGYGPLVKRALDRSIPYLHPGFRIVDGETRHRRRHRNALSLAVWLYGTSTPGERAVALELVRANARSLGAGLRGVWFPESPGALDLSAGDAWDGRPSPRGLPLDPTTGPGRPPRRVALLCASPKGEESASWALLSDLAEAVRAFAELGGVTPPEMRLVRCRPSGGLPDGRSPLDGDAIVVGYPLYVDGPPSGLVATLERLANEPRRGRRPGVYALGNLGLYEPRQLRPSLAVLRGFCEGKGLPWRGAVAVGGGGMVLPTARSPRMGMLRRPVSEAIDQLALALLAGRPLGVVEARCALPRSAYLLAAEAGWRKAARESGVCLDEAPTALP